MESRYKRLGKNTLLVFLGKAGSSIIGMLMLPFYTHWLSTDEYGTTDLITTYAAILMGFISCCVADSIFIFPKNADERGRSRYYTSGYLFVAVMSVLFAGVFAGLHFLSSNQGWGGTFFERIWFVLAFAVCQFIQQYSQSFTRSIDKMQVFSITGIIYTAAIAILSFGFLPRYGLNGYLYAMIAANLIASCFSIFASGSYRYLSFRSYDSAALKELLKYGIPLIPNGLMWWLVNGLNRPVMEADLGLDALGIYAVANKFPGLLSALVAIFSTAWGITMLEEFGKPDFNHFFNRTIKSLFFIMVIGGCVLSALSKVIIYVFADAAYFEAWKYVPVLTLSVALQNFSSLIGGVFMAEKKSKYFFYSSLWGAVASVVATVIGIRLWGLQGAAIAVAFSFFVMSISRLIYAWKHINEMKVAWYILMTILYILFIVVVLLDHSLYFNIPVYAAILALVYLLSRDRLIPSKQ